MTFHSDIEKDIPLPERESAERRYPIADMDVDDSFFVPITPENEEGAIRSTLYSTARRLNVKVTLNKREEDGAIGIRCWRYE